MVMIIKARLEICPKLSYVYRVPNTVIRPRPSCPLLCITLIIIIIIMIIIVVVVVLIIVLITIIFFMVIMTKKRKLAGRTSRGVAFSCLCLPSLASSPIYTVHCRAGSPKYIELYCDALPRWGPQPKSGYTTLWSAYCTVAVGFCLLLA